MILSKVQIKICSKTLRFCFPFEFSNLWKKFLSHCRFKSLSQPSLYPNPNPNQIYDVQYIHFTLIFLLMTFTKHFYIGKRRMKRKMKRTTWTCCNLSTKKLSSGLMEQKIMLQNEASAYSIQHPLPN